MWQSSRRCLLRHQPMNGSQSHPASSKAVMGTKEMVNTTLVAIPIIRSSLGNR